MLTNRGVLKTNIENGEKIVAIRKRYFEYDRKNWTYWSWKERIVLENVKSDNTRSSSSLNVEII